MLIRNGWGKKMLITWLLLPALSLTLDSCASPTIINRIKLIQTAGYDLQGKEVRVSALLGDYKEADKTEVIYMDNSSTNSYDMIPVLNQETNDPIQYGQMRMMVFGQEYAKRGIGSVLNILSRDVKISSRLKLGVSDTTAAELLKASMPSQEPLYLMRMVEQNAKQANLPLQNLHVTLTNYYADGKDVFLPSFHLDKEKQVKLDGLVLFKEDRAIVKIGIEDALWLKLLIANAKNGSFIAPVEESNVQMDRVALIRFASSKATFSAGNLKEPHQLNVKVTGNVIVKNVPADLELTAPDEVKRLEKDLEQYVTAKLEALIRFCCSKQVDPIGIGDFYRSRDRHWNKEEFYAAYPSLKANIQVNLKIIQCGRQD